MNEKNADTKNNSNQKIKQIVTFELSNEQYGVDIMQTQEIIKMEKITSVPNSLDFVKGVINLRGNVIPIIDLKKRFNLIGSEKPKGIIIFRLENLTLGILIDNMPQVISLAENYILSPPSVVSEIGQEHIIGLIKKDNDNNLLLILNINKLLSNKEINLIQKSN